MSYQTGPGNGRRQWALPIVHRPGANAQATITVPAAGANARNVCTGFTVTFVAGATAPTAVTVKAHLIDGISGATTYLWGTTLGLPNVAGAVNGVARPGRWVGTENTPMTLEFDVAGGANTIESVSMEGHTELG